MSEFGRNDPCPCQSGRKYKHCHGSASRPSARSVPGSNGGLPPLASGFDDLTVKERNIAFLNVLHDALQVDKLAKKDWPSIKRMITPTSVRKINEGIVRIWPRTTDVDHVLARRDSRQAGFYTGDYRPHKLKEAVGRHLVYADVVTLADPFIYPFSLRDEFSPLLHPQKHLTNTAKNVNVWFSLASLIEQGLVELVRPPSDFDSRLNMDNLVAMDDLHKRHPALMELVEKYSKSQPQDEFTEHKEWMMLLQPDSQIRRQLLTDVPGISVAQIEEVLSHFRQRRKEHPFFVHADDELVAQFYGGTAYDALQMAKMTGAYLLTDLEPRWRQLETIKGELGEGIDERMKVAHSLQGLSLPMASYFDLDLAKRIRDQGQLERVRGLLDKLMRDASSDKPLSEQDAKAFQHELSDAIAEAKDEYAAIDRDLLKWVGAEAVGAAGFAAMAPAALAISLGALAFAGVVHLGASAWARRTFSEKYPAGMFMGVSIR